MTRGNQRETDRARAAARAAKQAKSKKDGLDPIARRERCVCGDTPPLGFAAQRCAD